MKQNKMFPNFPPGLFSVECCSQEQNTKQQRMRKWRIRTEMAGSKVSPLAG